MSPFRCPESFLDLERLGIRIRGSFIRRADAGALSEAMAKVARRMGARIHLDETVTGLEFDGKKVKAVTTSSGRHRTDALVINADFARAMKRLVPDSLRRRWTDRKIETKQFSCSTFMMYLGVEGAL